MKIKNGQWIEENAMRDEIWALKEIVFLLLEGKA